MKHLFLILVILQVASVLWAQEEPPRPIRPPDEMEKKAIQDMASDEDREKIQQMIMLERFLSMPDEQLVSIRKTLETIEAMSAEEKAVYRKKVREYLRMEAEKRRKLHQEWRKGPRHGPRHIAPFEHYFRILSEEERQAFLSDIADLPPEEQQQRRRELVEHLIREGRASPQHAPGTGSRGPRWQTDE